MNKTAWLRALLVSILWTAPAHALDWIEQASKPGPDIPAAGQSRFDQLYRGTDGRYRIPYPFERLIEDLEARLDNGGNPAVRRVFVPLGRSLQRDAPAPDHFRFPREIIALDGEPATRGRQAGLVLRYRLFIAHQPKTETLEVISYNDAAGRFEFQLVENYSAGNTARVRAANRLMCMSCHHNAAPIFPRTPWRETSFNIEVARRMVAALPARFESLIGLVTLDAGVIDVLSERANYLAAAQTVWRLGCASPACRAQMLSAALQYRLSGDSSFDWSSAGFRQLYFAELSRNWARRWPGGLALSASRLSDRDPLAPDSGALEHDPLQPRPPQATWHGVDDTLARGIIFRLAGFFTRADIERLDRRLIEINRQNPAAEYRHAAGCRAQATGADTILLRCGEEAGIDGLQAELEIEIIAGAAVPVRFLSLRLPRDTTLMQPVVTGFSRSSGRFEIQAGHSSGLSQRLPNGDRLAAVKLRWDGAATATNSRLELRFSAESAILQNALQKMLAARGDSLGQDVFRRQAILQDLMPLLGQAELDWGRPGPTAKRKDRTTAVQLDGVLALLQPYCAPCHADDSTHPPGFLAGASVASRVSRCAPRMLRRLQAWQPGGGVALSPMPPPASIGFSGMSAAEWPRSDHYRNLVSSLENLLAEQQGDARANAAYAALPTCLPSAE